MRCLCIVAVFQSQLKKKKRYPTCSVREALYGVKNPTAIQNSDVVGRMKDTKIIAYSDRMKVCRHYSLSFIYLKTGYGIIRWTSDWNLEMLWIAERLPEIWIKLIGLLLRACMSDKQKGYYLGYMITFPVFATDVDVREVGKGNVQLLSIRFSLPSVATHTVLLLKPWDLHLWCWVVMAFVEQIKI